MTPTDAPSTTARPHPATDRLLALCESELALPARTIHVGTPITEVGDSLDWLELLMAVEETFGVELDPAQTKSIRTVADLLRLLPAQADERLDRDVQNAVQQALQGMVPRPF
jgi:hypothetical protein